MAKLQWESLKPEVQDRLMDANPDLAIWLGMDGEEEVTGQKRQKRQATGVTGRKRTTRDGAWDGIAGGILANYWTRWLLWFTVLVVLVIVLA